MMAFNMPKHAAVNIVCCICCVDGLFVGFVVVVFSFDVQGC